MQVPAWARMRCCVSHQLPAGAQAPSCRSQDQRRWIHLRFKPGFLSRLLIGPIWRTSFTSNGSFQAIPMQPGLELHIDACLSPFHHLKRRPYV